MAPTRLSQEFRMTYARTVALSAVSIVSCLALAAAPADPAAPAPAVPQEATAASTVTLDPVHSMAVFRVHHLGAGFFWGRFNELSGSAVWPMDDSAAPVFDVTAEVAKVDTGSSKLDGNLQGPNFFNQAEFPTIAFKSKSGERVGERRWKVKGDLTLRGVTKEIEVDCEVTGVGKGPAGPKVGFECSFTILRADHGMKWGIEQPKGALGNEVRMIVSLEGDVAK
jgi:polyisoprenoid-binding protein YceI